MITGLPWRVHAGNLGPAPFRPRKPGPHHDPNQIVKYLDQHVSIQNSQSRGTSREGVQHALLKIIERLPVVATLKPLSREMMARIAALFEDPRFIGAPVSAWRSTSDATRSTEKFRAFRNS